MKSLRSKVSKVSKGLRVRTMNEQDRDMPIHFKEDSIIFDGKLRTRKRIVLLTAGCGIGTCTMCPFPNESLAGVTEENIINQFENSFKDTDINDYEVITIFNNGNFFRDAEVSPVVRDHIYKRVAESNAKYLSVESLPQFTNAKKILDAKLKLGGKKLAVFMGIQTANDFIRETAINTTCTKKAFETATHNLLSNGFIPVAFLMIKPPFLTETEAIEDAVASVQYLASIGVTYATLCPTRVAPNTLLEILHNRGDYSPPWTWSVIEVLKRATLPELMVNTSELKPEMNLDSVCADGCPKCNERNVKAIESYLYSRDLSEISDLSCDCQKEYEEFKVGEDERWRHISIEDRIEMFLNKKELV